MTKPWRGMVKAETRTKKGMAAHAASKRAQEKGGVRRPARSAPAQDGSASAAQAAANSWAAAAWEGAARVFEGMSDADFLFGTSVHHVYLYSEITADSVERLRAQVDELVGKAAGGSSSTPPPPSAPAPAPVQPAGTPSGARDSAPERKPIVVHVNSPGGDLHAGLAMMAVLLECPVPLAVCVDGMSCSAATLLSILAPYRVMTHLSVCLVHEYSAMLVGRRSEIHEETDGLDALFASIRSVYLRRTRMQPDQLDQMLERDLVLPAATCLKVGICDRVLQEGPGGSERSKDAAVKGGVPAANALRGAFGSPVHHVRLGCETWEQMMGLRGVAQLTAAIEAPRALPIVLHCDSFSCVPNLWGEVAPAVARLTAYTRAPTYGVIETGVQLMGALPALFCSRRIMYTHATLTMQLQPSMTSSDRLPDAVDNTRMKTDMVLSILRQRTRLPAAVLDRLQAGQLMLTAQDCLRYGVVDELVSVLPSKRRGA